MTVAIITSLDVAAHERAVAHPHRDAPGVRRASQRGESSRDREEDRHRLRRLPDRLSHWGGVLEIGEVAPIRRSRHRTVGGRLHHLRAPGRGGESSAASVEAAGLRRRHREVGQLPPRGGWRARTRPHSRRRSPPGRSTRVSLPPRVRTVDHGEEDDNASGGGAALCAGGMCAAPGLAGTHPAVPPFGGGAARRRIL